jgi:hypothetical protein
MVRQVLSALRSALSLFPLGAGGGRRGLFVCAQIQTYSVCTYSLSLSTHIHFTPLPPVRAGSSKYVLTSGTCCIQSLRLATKTSRSGAYKLLRCGTVGVGNVTLVLVSVVLCCSALRDATRIDGFTSPERKRPFS